MLKNRKFTLVQMLASLALLAVMCGWVFDRRRMADQIAKLKRSHEQEESQLWKALPLKAEARSLSLIYQQHKIASARGQHRQLARSLEADLLLVLWKLWFYESDLRGLDFLDPQEEARRVLATLSCANMGDISRLASRLGLATESFPAWADNSSREFAEFSQFVRDSLDGLHGSDGEVSDQADR